MSATKVVVNPVGPVRVSSGTVNVAYTRKTTLPYLNVTMKGSSTIRTDFQYVLFWGDDTNFHPTAAIESTTGNTRIFVEKKIKQLPIFKNCAAVYIFDENDVISSTVPITPFDFNPGFEYHEVRTLMISHRIRS